MQKLILIIGVLFTFNLYAAGFLGAHYDISRKSTIYSFVYQEPIKKFYVNGFLEIWWNPQEPMTFPQNIWVYYSKHWITYPLTKTINISSELEISKNFPGYWTRFPTDNYFETGKITFIPKIGLQLKLW